LIISIDEIDEIDENDPRATYFLLQPIYEFPIHGSNAYPWIGYNTGGDPHPWIGVNPR